MIEEKLEVEINAYYKDTDGTISKLVGIDYLRYENLATLYEMLIIKEGKYPSLNRNPLVSYTSSAMKRCRKLSYAEVLAVVM